jgi:hypothetical protein
LQRIAQDQPADAIGGRVAGRRQLDQIRDVT